MPGNEEGKQRWDGHEIIGDGMNETSEVRYAPKQQNTVYFILTSVAVCHLLNDMMSSSLLPSLYPMFKTLLQPELRADRAAGPDLSVDCLLAAAACGSLHGPSSQALFAADRARLDPRRSFVAFGCVQFSRGCFCGCLGGMGSSVFHPESSRVARMASGGRYGLAQSLFQVGGNVGRPAARC